MAQFNSNASISTGGDCDRGSQGSIDWVYQGLVVYKDPENIKNLESLKVLEENARATLHLKSGPGAGLPPLVSPLSPAVFQEQLEILTTLDLLDYNYPYLTPRTDALACLFREDNWKDAQEAVIEGDNEETIERFRLLATLMSGWDAFFNASINNRWGLKLGKNGCYAFSSCLLNLQVGGEGLQLEALTAKALYISAVFFPVFTQLLQVVYYLCRENLLDPGQLKTLSDAKLNPTPKLSQLSGDLKKNAITATGTAVPDTVKAFFAPKKSPGVRVEEILMQR
ncbi:hypothetical protein Ndes2437B_g02609 [Nannochloris sp. 'desiccata']